MDIENTLNHGSFEEFQEITTFKDNHLWWLSSIVSAIEKRKLAALLFSRGYSLKEVEDLLVLGTGEATIIKQHLDKYGAMDMDSIVKALKEIYIKQTLESIIERMVNKNYDTDDIIEVMKHLKE